MAASYIKASRLLSAWVSALIAALPMLGTPMAADSDACAHLETPPGARSMGYVRQVFCVAPTTADISADDGISSKLYSGKWYDRNPASLSLYSMSGNTLVLSNGAALMTETRKSSPGALPLLPAAAGFYVEFAERLSDNDPDHFPAVWLMPQEHNAAQSDHMAGDPAGLEHWMELDVDEGGYNTGHLGTMISWSGTSPNFKHDNKAVAPSSTFGMDRTQVHVFGLSYDPAGKLVTWWVDGISVGSVSTAGIPTIVNSHHYYLLINNQNHGLNHPYKMYIPYFSAWSSGVVPSPPSGIRAEKVTQ